MTKAPSRVAATSDAFFVVQSRHAMTEGLYLASSSAGKKLEMLCALLKHSMRLGRLRLREPNAAKDEFHLAATVQNLRKLAGGVPTTPEVA